MKKTFTLVILSIAILFASAQRKKSDSLIAVLKSAPTNGRRMAVLEQLAGRLLLNLFSNACYAVHQKAKTVAGHSFGAAASY